MRFVPSLVCTTFACLSLAAVAADAPSIANLKNLRIGMTLAELRVLSTEQGGFSGTAFRCLASGRIVRCRYNDSATVAQIPAEVSLYFVSSADAPPPLTSNQRRMLSDEQMAEAQKLVEAGYQLAVIRVEIESSSHPELLEAYRAKAGAPKDVGTDRYTNAFGATFTGTRHDWASNGVTASLWERCERIDTSCLLIESTRFNKAIRDAAAASQRERQRDL